MIPAKTTNDLSLCCLPLPSQDGIRYASLSEIIYCEADGNYTSVFLSENERRLVSCPLKELDDQLTGHGFFRVHQSYLVNLRYVREYLREDGGKLLLLGGGVAYVSRSRRRAFFQAMKTRFLGNGK